MTKRSPFRPLFAADKPSDDSAQISNNQKMSFLQSITGKSVVGELQETVSQVLPNGLAGCPEPFGRVSEIVWQGVRDRFLEKAKRFLSQREKSRESFSHDFV